MYTSTKGGEKYSRGSFIHIMGKKIFFSVKKWERSTEIAHLSFASLKGIFNNLEYTPRSFGIKKNQNLKIITLFNLSKISIQSWPLSFEAVRHEYVS